MFNPWLILGVVALVIGAAFGGYQQGKKVERAGWMERENKELAAANAKILALNKAARDAEERHAAELNLISTTLQGEVDVAKKKTADLVAASRAGTFRLRDPAASKNAGRCAAGETGPAASKRDEGKGAELSGAASEFLLGLTGEADEVVRQLTACQAVITDDRKVH